MENDFQPLYEEKEGEAFSIWDIKGQEPEPLIETDPQEELAKECERIREEAREEGYQKGLQQATDYLSKKQQDLELCINLLQQPISLIDNRLSQEVIKTIIWLCEACIGIELSIHPEKLITLWEQIKRELPTLQGDKKLAMHPDDVNYLTKELNELKESAPPSFLVADKSLKRGDFYLQNEYNDLDGCLKTRLQKIFETYLEDEGWEHSSNLYPERNDGSS